MKKKILAFGLAVFLIGGGVFANNLKINLNGFHFVAPTVIGKSNVYAPQTGEIVYDAFDSKFWGYDQTGTWVNLTGGAGDATPTGAMLPYAGASAPAGYLIADGASLSRTEYPNLYAAIGTTYGSVDLEHFNLPDTRNVFLRGVNTNPRTINSVSYPAVALGSTANDKFQGHWHGFNSVMRYGLAIAQGSGIYGIRDVGTDIVATNPISDGTNGAPRTGSETAPVNLGVNYIIKY